MCGAGQTGGVSIDVASASIPVSTGTTGVEQPTTNASASTVASDDPGNLIRVLLEEATREHAGRPVHHSQRRGAFTRPEDIESEMGLLVTSPRYRLIAGRTNATVESEVEARVDATVIGACVDRTVELARESAIGPAVTDSGAARRFGICALDARHARIPEARCRSRTKHVRRIARGTVAAVVFTVDGRTREVGPGAPAVGLHGPAVARGHDASAQQTALTCSTWIVVHHDRRRTRDLTRIDQWYLTNSHRVALPDVGLTAAQHRRESAVATRRVRAALLALVDALRSRHGFDTRGAHGTSAIDDSATSTRGSRTCSERDSEGDRERDPGVRRAASHRAQLTSCTRR